LIAQEVNKAVSERNNEPTEIIEVSGVRASLENALNVKREASSIVDAISATDIDALPALDFGEALQAIPGVQLNSDQEGRLSSISLRGLGGGFVKTTAFGQSFATPSGASSLNAVGSPNPFAAFEAGVFDGVTVVKSPTADLQEGGVAGIVDKKLQQALSKKDGTATLSFGGRYEELTENWDPNVRASGVKHIIEDKLAVGFKFAASGQTFRRDTFDIIDYVNVDDVILGPERRRRLNLPERTDVRATNIAEYRALHGIPDNAQVSVPLRGRNVSEFSDGERFSFSGNIEYRVTDDFKIGAHILLSERDLKDGTKEESSISPGFNRNNRANDPLDARILLDLETAPFEYDVAREGDNVVPVFAATNYSFTNGTLRNSNRRTTFKESSEGIILYGDYAAGDWVLDGVITHSEAENEFANIGLVLDHGQDWNLVPTVSDSEGVRRNVPAVPSGFDGVINTGFGEVEDIQIQGAFRPVNGEFGGFVYDDLRWTLPTLTSTAINSFDDANQGRRVQFQLNGRVRDLSRELSSVEFNAQRYTDFGFGDGLRFDSVKFGARYSEEDLSSIDQRQGPGGININNISSAILTDQVLSAVQADYFGGNIPGTFDNTNGWITFDNDLAIAALQDGIAETAEEIGTGTNISTVSPLTGRNRSGFYETQDRNTGLPNNLGFNFDATQSIAAIYAMTNFSGEFGDIFFRGNFGVRHIETDNQFQGFEISVDERGRNGVATIVELEDDYTHTLPMANISFELSEDVILRTAYYEGIVRPNLLAQTPAANLRGGLSSATVTLPGATVRPYEAANYDVSLEWYNREGSAISIGFFQKDITNLFDQFEGNCPADGSNAIVNELLGPLRVTDGGNNGEPGCEQVTPVLDDDGNEIFREVTIREPINNNNKLSVEGFELAIQQNLDFLPYPWNGFGGVFNYTKLRQSGDAEALNRVSPQSYNLIGYWENDGVSLRLSYNWRDDLSIRGANSFLGTNTRIREAVGRLDFVGSYKLNKKTKVFLRGFNLTDEIGREYLGSDPRAISRLTYTGRIYQVAVNYRF
jgi:TonB-dependent receptor